MMSGVVLSASLKPASSVKADARLPSSRSAWFSLMRSDLYIEGFIQDDDGPDCKGVHALVSVPTLAFAWPFFVPFL